MTSRSLRIAMYAHTLDHGGITRVVFTVAEQLAELGVRTAIVGATAKKTVPVLPPDAAVEVIDLGLGKRNHVFSVPRLARWLREWRPNVLFAHGTSANSAAVLARRVSFVPASLILVEHNHYSSFEPTSGGPWRYRSLRDLETATLYPLADAVGGVSRGVRDDLASRFPRLRPRLVVLPNPGWSAADVKRLTGSRPAHPWFSRRADGPIVTCVGNIVPRKGQETLIAALAPVREQVGGVRLVLVGRIDNQRYAAQLEQQAARSGVSDFVSFAGHQPNPLSFMAHSDVVALSSTTEGFGLALIEAMACRVPVVATDCPTGPAEVLDGGRAGLLVPVGDPQAMADAIVRLLRDAELRDRLVARGEERARAHEPSLVAQAYLALARRVARGGAHRTFQQHASPGLDQDDSPKR